MRTKSQQQVYTIVLEFPLGIVRSVKVKAGSREVAERRAMKRNPSAIGIKER